MNVLNDLVMSYEVAGCNLYSALLDDARSIYWMLALISVTWSLIRLASRKGSETLVTQVGRHILFFGIFGALLEVFPQSIGSIPRMFMEAGHQATGADTFFNPDNILSAGFGLAVRLLVSTDIFSILTGAGLIVRVIGAVIIMAAFVVIALKVTQLLIEQYIAVLGIGVFLFAFTGNKWTWSLGEGLIRYAVHLGIRLMLLVVLFDVGKSLVTIWNEALSGPFDFLSFRGWIQITIGPLIFAFVTWTVPERAANQIASRISFPNPHAV